MSNILKIFIKAVDKVVAVVPPIIPPIVVSVVAPAAPPAPAFSGTIWNSADKGANINLTNGDLTVAQVGGAWNSVRAVAYKTTGKHYFEITCGNLTPQSYCGPGVVTNAAAMSSYFPTHTDGHSYYGNSGNAWNGNAVSAWGDTYTDGDVLGIAVDLDNSVIYFSKNGVWQNSSDPESGASKTGAHNAKHYLYSGRSYAPAVATYGGTDSIVANFGDSAFTYTVPTGYAEGWAE